MTRYNHHFPQLHFTSSNSNMFWMNQGFHQPADGYQSWVSWHFRRVTEGFQRAALDQRRGKQFEWLVGSRLWTRKSGIKISGESWWSAVGEGREGGGLSKDGKGSNDIATVGRSGLIILLHQQPSKEGEKLILLQKWKKSADTELFSWAAALFISWFNLFNIYKQTGFIAFTDEY